MPTTALPRIPAADVEALRRGDERAFERLVRTEYPAVLDMVRTELGKDAAPYKAVETTFLRLWNARETLDGPDAIAQFLRETSHELALREKSRRGALHRFEAHENVRIEHGSHGPELTVDDVWSRITDTLHAKPLDAADMQQRDQVLRHEAAQHLSAATARKSPVGLIVGIAVLGVALAVGLRMMSKGGEVYALNKALAADDVRALQAQFGQRANVTLGDETKLLIGADSKVTVPSAFGNTLRGVKLEGTASFTVVRPAATDVDPFEVRSGGIRLIAKGTIFDARTDLGSDLFLRVREGTVAVSSKAHDTDVATGRTVKIDSTGVVTDASAAEAATAFDWVDGKYTTATGATLRTVLPELRRWYRLDLSVVDSALLANPVSFTASLESSKEAIAALEQSGGVKFGYDKDENMILSKAPPAPAPKAAKKAR
ncbi:MAG: FecR domain-containing protein [Gemmatimonadaceae bacterium]|jgi:ferric-dicitrate binding protein FerR (iron transport regulator)|nr:FecR domain-containing protein [Gemmatimonadaceae bacterium]